MAKLKKLAQNTARELNTQRNLAIREQQEQATSISTPSFSAPSVGVQTSTPAFSTPSYTAPSITPTDSLDRLTQMRDTLSQERTSIQRDYTLLRAQELDNTMSGTFSSRFKTATEAQDALKKIDDELTKIASQYYNVKSQGEKKALLEDKPSYQSKKDIDAMQADLDRLDAEIQKMEARDQEGGFNTSAIRKELSEKYGLTAKTYSAHSFRDAMKAQLDSAKAQLKDAGHDYDKITAYDKTFADQAKAKKTEETTRQYASQHPVASSIVSVAASPLQGIDYAGALLKGIGHSDTDKLDEYVPLNSYNMLATNFVSTVRDQVSKDIEKKTDWEIAGQNVASFLYNTGMSIADSASQIATLGPASMVFMGASAASNQAKKIIDEGGTNAQALWSGLAAGAAEAIFEKFSIDNLLKAKTIGDVKSLLRETLKQAGTEASEEVFTEISNILSDVAIMGDSSDFAKMVAAYKEEGFTEEEARKKAIYDCIGQVVWAGIGGALSGGVMGGVKGTSDMVKTQNLGRGIKTGAVSNVNQFGEVQKALENTESKEAQKLAKKAQKELEKTGKISDGTVGQLVQQNAQDLQELIKLAAESDNAEVQSVLAVALVQQMTGSGVDSATVSGLRAAMALAKQGNTVSPAAAPQVQQTAQQAVQTKAANPKADVLNAAETLFVQHGMSLKTAKKRADIVSRLVAGEKVDDDEIGSMEPTNPQTQADFTTLTGVQFPEGVNKSIEKLRATYRSAHEVAVQAQAQQQLEAQTVAESTTVPAAEVAADDRLGLFGADGQELMTLDQFAAANQLAPEAAEEAYMDYILGNATVEHQGKRMNYTQYGEFLRSAPGGDQLAEDEITAYFERELSRGAEKAGVAPRHSLPEETAAEASAREQIVQAAEKTRSAELEAQAKSIQKTLKDFGLKTTVVVEQNPEFDDFAFYDSTNNRIVFNGQRLTTGNAMVWTLGHELVHKITNNGTQNMEFVDAVISAFDTLNKQNALGGKLKFWMDNMDTRISELKNTYTLFLAEHGEDTSVVTDEYAREELAGDLMREAFVNEGVLNALAGDNPGIIYRAQLKVQEWLGKLRGVEQAEAQETLKSLSEKFQNALKQSEVNEAMQPPEKRHSIDSMAESVGLTFEKDGQLTVFKDSKGNRVNEVSEQMIEKSPLGAVIQSAVDADFISQEDAAKQVKFFSDLFNLMIKTQDIDLLWAVSASIGFQPIESGARDASTINQKSRFAGYTKNSDPQYSTTVDFTTICLKTQAIIDAMSETMMQLGQGLTEEEIVDIVYRNTHKAGEPVPCPVCYVFSRWVGLGGLFDNMNQLQNQYANADPEVLRGDMALLEERINEIMAERGYALQTGKKGTKSYVLPGTSSKKSFGDAKTIMYKDMVTRQTELQSKKNQDTISGKKTMTKAENAELEQLKKDINILDNWTWLNDVRLSDNYEPVPPEILFNINAGKEFAEQYPESWKYRTTRGPAMGKAATPYADEHLGQILRGAGISDLKGADLGNPAKNPFLSANDGKLTPAARKALQKSRAKIKAQNLLNGQRYQSTSDFRFEYALDYLLSFIEMQALGGKVQLYTKVAEAVRMFASVGAEVNCSLMPLGIGYRVNKDGSKTLTFSSVTGMNAEDAFNLSSEFDNVQPIMVGVGNEHIRLCMADDRISFIIPYHASGAGESRYVALMDIVGESVESREDYSAYQTDHKIENPTKEQKAAYDLRMRLLTGKMGMLKDADKQVLRNNEILHNLYKRFYGKDVDGNLSDIDPKYLSPEIRESGKLFRDNECYGVFLTKEQAGTVMPFEYWDRTSTIENADVNGQAFAEYCESLGLRPRFSGWDGNGKYHAETDFSKESGYWKMLIDRRCYNRDGSYHEQQTIDATNFDADFLLRDKAVEGIVQPSLVNDPAKTAKIAAKSVEEVKARRKYSVVGENAAAVDRTKLSEAEAKIRNGWNPDLVWFTTGWWQGKDGKWRTEISDHEMQYKPDHRKAKTLAELITHDKLFAQYPEMKNIKVSYEDLGKTTRGAYDAPTNTLRLNQNRSDAELLKTILHEMQHWIQGKEGFALGSNTFNAYVKLFNDAYLRVKDRPVFKRIKTYEKRVKAIEREITARSTESLGAMVYKLYQSSIGETEARDTADRADYDGALRSMLQPYMAQTGDLTDLNYRAQNARDFVDLHKLLGHNGVDKPYTPGYDFAKTNGWTEEEFDDGTAQQRTDEVSVRASLDLPAESNRGTKASQNENADRSVQRNVGRHGAESGRSVTNQASEESGAFNLPSIDENPTKDPDIRYSITPEFEKWYKEQYNTDDVTDKQLQRRMETLERRAAEAKESAKAAEQNSIDAWRIYHTKKMREQKRVSDAKLAAARKEKTEAVRAAVAETKVIERAKAEVQHDADRMAERRNAAKRLRTQENAYQQKVTDLKENAKLKRNAAKATLRDKNRADRKRAEIEAEQGLVDTIRKSPKERTRVEKLQENAGNLRTLGRAAYRNFVNVAEAIDRFSKRQVSEMRAGTLVNIVGSSTSTVESIFKKGLVNRAGDRIGDSMSDVFMCWDDAHKSVDENKQALLQDFMLHWHNIDRMSIVSRAESRLETFENENEWLRDMDKKEFARLVAMTETEAKKLGKEAAQLKAFEYERLLREYNEAANKPIFADDKGNAVTAETSQEIVHKYMEEHPWVVEKANGIYEWWDKFMREWAVGDTISGAEYQRMRDMYPHYAPTYRADKNGVGGANFVGMGGANVSKAVKRAKGSFAEVVNIEDSFANMVSKIVKLNRVNELYMNIIDTAMLDEDGTFADLAFFDWDSSWQTGDYAKALQSGELDETVNDAETTGLEKVGSDYKLTAWRDGRKYTAFISEELYLSIGGVTGHLANDLEQNLLKIGNALTGPMKTAITGINPNFALRNLSRDLPTAIVNSISGMAFPKYWAQAAAEMAQNSEHWQNFQALGGTHATHYNTQSGAKQLTQSENLGKRALGKLGWFNDVTESQTRFAEYLATVDRLGDTYESRLQGIKNAAEVTVDFSRKGRYGKVINAWVPYWNPAVQGIDKVVRSVIESPDGSAVWKQASKTLGRAAMTTVLLEAILQGVLHALDRDDEWEELDDRTKDTYYCIPLKDEKKFLKIPKNREWGAILGTPFMRMLEYANGRENPFENYIETAIEPNFLPPAIFRPDAGGGFSTDMIGFSQMNDLSKNEDFAGRAIVPYAYQQGSLSQQYDADTSWVAKQLGELFNWSPMQIDYIISDYFGDFGDLFQIATSGATWNGDKSFPDAALDVVASPWTVDTRYSNAGVSKYYDTMSDLEKVVQDKKNQLGNEAYKETVEYQTHKAVKDLYGDQITELNRAVRELPDGEEKDLLKGQIAQLTSDALQYYDDCMAGRVSNPVLDAEYKDFNGTVSAELIRLDNLSDEYKFKPTGNPSAKYTDPRNKQLEYVLTDDQKDYFKQLYRDTYDEMFLHMIQSSAYKKLTDAKKATKLEELRDDVLDATKDEFFDWLRKSGVRSIPKTKK